MQAKPRLITLLLANSYLVVREGVRSILASASDIQIVGEAENGEDIKKMMPKLRPNILLLGLKMRGISPFEIGKWVRRNYPETSILVLTVYDHDFYLANMMDAGVAGYLSKPEDAENLIATIHGAASGNIFFTQEQFTRARTWRQEAGEKWAKLTRRQREVLSLMEKGLSNMAISEHLGVEPKTAAYHVSAIFSKLDVGSRYEADAWYRKYFPQELE